MNASDSRRLEAIFTALSEPTRRMVMERLSQAGATVTELSEPFSISLPAFLKHVKVLEDAGLVTRRRVGRTNHITIDPDGIRTAVSWLLQRMPAPTASTEVHTARRGSSVVISRARALHRTLEMPVALMRRALEDAAPLDEGFGPEDSAVRAMRAASSLRPSMVECIRLFDELTGQLEAAAQGQPCDALPDLILPLGRLLHELKPLLPAEQGIA